MSQYKVVLKPQAEKVLRKLSKRLFRRVMDAILNLRSNPFPNGCKKLYGYDGYYRIRVSNYRIVYHVGKTVRIVTVIRLQHRKDVYKDL